MKSLIFLLLFLLPLFSFSQKVVFEDRPDTAAPEENPYRKFSVTPFVQHGMITGSPSGPGAAIYYPRSWNFRLGITFRQGIGKRLTFLTDLFYSSFRYQLRNHLSKEIPDLPVYYNEHLKLNVIAANPTFRIHFNRFRGKISGVYADLGCMAGWVAGGRHVYVLRNTSPEAEETKVKHGGLSYLESFVLAPEARLGIGKVSVFGSYRASDVLISPYSDLPRFAFGLRVMVRD